MQDILNSITASSQEEVNCLETLANDLSENEFYNLKKSVLNIFIENQNMLEFVLEKNLYTWEISIILEKSNNLYFFQGLRSLIEDLKKSFYIDKSNFIKTIEDDYMEIHEALNAYHDTYFLQNIPDEKKIRHFSRACFRHIGDTIEATFKPHIAMIYNLLKIGENNIKISNSKNPSFGDHVSSLLGIDYLEKIYVNELKGVSLNQWRNISQHSSYRVDESANTILCTYGNKKTIILSPLEIKEVMMKLDEIHTIHTIAISFIMLEFTEEINLNSNISHITIETIVSDICSTLLTYQYPVIEIIEEEKKYKFIILDKNIGLKPGFIKALHQVSSQIFMLEEKGIFPFFGLYSESGHKIAEGKLTIQEKEKSSLTPLS